MITPVGPPPQRLVYIVTVPMSARYHLRGHLAYMREHGYDVTVVSSPGADLNLVAEREGVRTVAVPMAREVDLRRDLVALWRLCRALGAIRPHVVTAGTPKAGLLGMLAARLTRVPIRVYSLLGLRSETATGFTRRVLDATERLASSSAHRVVCVSRSLAEAYVARGLCPPTKAIVLGHGSANGVSAERFGPVALGNGAARLRASLGIPGESPVIGFVGRFTRDKGMTELLQAYERALAAVPACRLLLVGDFETGDPVPEDVRLGLIRHPGVVHTGMVQDAAPYYPLMDVLAFPSYREGFPTVPLEAAAAGVPCVGFAATGTVDAVQHGVTGLLVRTGDAAALADGLTLMLRDDTLRARMGRAGRERVERDFGPERVWENWRALYDALDRERR